MTVRVGPDNGYHPTAHLRWLVITDEIMPELKLVKRRVLQQLWQSSFGYEDVWQDVEGVLA